MDEFLALFTIFPNWFDRSKALATAFGIPVAASGEGYTVNTDSRLGVPSLLPEVSGNGLWGSDTVRQMTAGILLRVTHHLGIIEGRVEPPSQAEPDLVTMWVSSAPCSGLWNPARDLSEPVAAGEVFGEIRDVFGAVLATVTSDKDGFILYRLSSLTANKREALLGVGTPVGR
jgi:predicted deacylase